MNVFELTRALINIESITGNEERVGEFLAQQLGALTREFGGNLSVDEVEPRRSNVLATFGDPVVTLSTHMDTVPPYFSSRDDGDYIWGRGAADTKGIIASMIVAARALLGHNVRGFALLFVVGEEKNSAGALYASGHPPSGPKRFLVNGEPTENKLALGSKGALRYEVVARGRMAHSAYPELGESAIEKLLDALGAVRKIEMPDDPVLGKSTVNIGVISGGRAPNIIADQARASVMFRLVGDAGPLRERTIAAVSPYAEAQEVLCIPAVHLGSLEGFETTIVAYTTDIPAFAGAWGKPLLIGPGSIHVAHTPEERVSKAQLEQAVVLYQRIVKQLLST